MDAGNAGHKRKTPENNNKEKKPKKARKKESACQRFCTASGPEYVLTGASE
jgi:hypothetical protein